MISFEDLEKHGYVRHYTDTPQAIENLKGKGRDRVLPTRDLRPRA
jgi:hypothetical protein